MAISERDKINYDRHYLLASVFIGGMTDRRLLVNTVGDSSSFSPDAMLGAITPTFDNPAELGL